MPQLGLGYFHVAVPFNFHEIDRFGLHVRDRNKGATLARVIASGNLDVVVVLKYRSGYWFVIQEALSDFADIHADS